MGERMPVEEHARFLRSLLAPLGARPSEVVALADALGRITASPVESPLDLPPFRNSQMDGFAVRATDVAAAPVVLPVSGEVAAAPGAPAALAAGTAVRIMTGAPVPDGADAVVPVEDTEPDGDGVRILRARGAGSTCAKPAPTSRRATTCCPRACGSPRGTSPPPRHPASPDCSCANACAWRS